MTLELAGGNCPYGGVRIRVGVDANGNDVLSPDEVISIEYVCNGQNGAKGDKGDTGDQGLQGIQGLQ